MGSPDGEGAADEHPRHRVYLDSFYMDKFEVTVSRYAEFLRETSRGSPRYQVNMGKHGNLPVAGVDWHDADSYCHWAGKRLPTEAEWEKAARGADGQAYPWGNEEPTSRLANFWSFKADEFIKPLPKAYERLTPVGNYEGGKSPYGVYDLAGSVWEWVADWYDESYYRQNVSRNPTGPTTGNTKVLRGGSMSGLFGTVRSADRSIPPTYGWFGVTGFRCARDALK